MVVNDFLLFSFTAFPIARRIGHPYQNRTPPKRKKPRTSFTRIQVSSTYRILNEKIFVLTNEKFLGCRIRKKISQAKIFSIS